VLDVKLVTTAIGHGPGTSGGILAPLLIMGAAIGGLLGSVLPGGTPADWAVLGMSGALAGVMRSPFTALIFAVELTHQVDLFLPLLFTTLVAHFISVLILKRSILTEKVARRGFHVLREYAVDPMDVLFVREVMATDVVTVASGFSMTEARAVLREFAGKRHQRLLPVIRDDELVGVVPWLDIIDTPAGRAAGIIDDLMVTRVITAFPDESLREVAERMALYRIGVLPVVERQDPARLRGLITQFDLLKARERNLQEERTREQVLQLWFLPRMAAFLWPSGGGDERDDTDDLPPS
jgi:CBS domain-containing protein